MRNVELGPHNNELRTNSCCSSNRAGTFCHECRYATVKNAVGLVNTWSDFYLADNFFWGGQDDFNPQLVVNVHFCRDVISHIHSLEVGL